MSAAGIARRSGRSHRSRRTVLAALGALAASRAGPALAQPHLAAGVPMRVGLDRVWVRNEHTGEEVDHPFAYPHEPDLDRKAWMSYSHLWRDVQDRGRAVWIDRAMLAMLARVQLEVSRRRGRETRLRLTSGYRTPERNATLEDAAPHSLHCAGRAADFWLEHTPHHEVQALATALQGVGGVGRYDGFTHIDTGEPGRRW